MILTITRLADRNPTGFWRRIEHGYWRLYHFPHYVRVWRARWSDDPDAWLNLLRVGVVPDPYPDEEDDDPETYWEEFDPEDWIGSTVN